MIELKTTFTRRELLWFGPLFALFAGMIGALALWRFEAPQVARGIWIFAAVVVLLYYLAPPLRRWIFIGWMALVFPLGFVLSHLILTAVFYLVVFPIGMLVRLFRYDALKRRADPGVSSYWIKRESRPDARSYFRQF